MTHVINLTSNIRLVFIFCIVFIMAPFLADRNVLLLREITSLEGNSPMLHENYYNFGPAIPSQSCDYSRKLDPAAHMILQQQ